MALFPRGITWRQRLARSTLAGATVGFVLFVPGLLSYLVGDPEQFVARFGSPTSLLGMYLSGGAAGGLLAGALAPLGRGRIGAVLVGTVSAVPLVFLALLYTRQRMTDWDAADLTFVVALSGLLGGIGGHRLRAEFLRRDSRANTAMR